MALATVVQASGNTWFLGHWTLRDLVSGKTFKISCHLVDSALSGVCIYIYIYTYILALLYVASLEPCTRERESTWTKTYTRGVLGAAIASVYNGPPMFGHPYLSCCQD